MTISIDTSIAHHFPMNRSLFLTSGLVCALCTAAFVWVHFTDWENMRRGASMYYFSFLGIPVFTIMVALSFAQWFRAGKYDYAITVDESGLIDNRVMLEKLSWKDIETINFKTQRVSWATVRSCEVTPREGHELSLRFPFNTRPLRPLSHVLTSKMTPPVIVNASGLRASFSKLRDVIAAFATLNPHIQILGLPARSHEQA
jgi:hypothetical protein